MDFAVSPQDRFMADLRKATSGISYTPQGVSQLAALAKGRGASQGSLDVIANAPVRSDAPVGSVGASVADAAAGGNGGGVTRTKFDYPAALPPIPPDVEAAFLQQRRVGTRGVEDARAYEQAGTQLAEARKLSAEQELTRQSGRNINATMAQAAAGGRAFSPAGVFGARRQILSGAERQQVILEEELAKTVQDLGRLVTDAERQKMEMDANIEMQRATLRSNAALEDARARRSIDMANWSAGLL